MKKKVTVVYENGVFRPLQKVNIKENAKIEIAIDIGDGAAEGDPNRELMDLLENPDRMGKILFKSRRELYDDIA